MANNTDDYIHPFYLVSRIGELAGAWGRMGTPNSKRIEWRLDAKQSGDGLVLDVGVHVVDRIDYQFGPLVNVNVKGKAENRTSRDVQEVEDYAHFDAVVCCWQSSSKQ